MNFKIGEEPISTLAEQAQIPIAFEIDRVLELSTPENGLGGICLSERKLAAPLTKDYDRIQGQEPAQWAKRFDVSNWGLIVARSDARRIGGAVVAFGSADVDMLEARRNAAVLWDIRVHPEFRGRQVGSALFNAVEMWAAQRRCRHLKVETQNTNVAACKFYVRQGCVLGSINRFAYPDLPGEVQLLWYKELVLSG